MRGRLRRNPHEIARRDRAAAGLRVPDPTKSRASFAIRVAASGPTFSPVRFAAISAGVLSACVVQSRRVTSRSRRRASEPAPAPRSRIRVSASARASRSVAASSEPLQHHRLSRSLSSAGEFERNCGEGSETRGCWSGYRFFWPIRRPTEGLWTSAEVAARNDCSRGTAVRSYGLPRPPRLPGAFPARPCRSGSRRPYSEVSTSAGFRGRSRRRRLRPWRRSGR